MELNVAKVCPINVLIIDNEKDSIESLLHEITNLKNNVPYEIIVEETSVAKEALELIKDKKDRTLTIVDLGIILPLDWDVGYAFTHGGSVLIKKIVDLKPRFDPIIYSVRENFEVKPDLINLQIEFIKNFVKGEGDSIKNIVSLIQKCYMELNK